MRRVDLYLDGAITKGSYIGSCDDGSDNLCLKQAPKQIVKEVKTEKVIERLMPVQDSRYGYALIPLVIACVYFWLRLRKIEKRMCRCR